MTQSKFISELGLLGIEINEIQLSQLEKYYELLVEYNKVMNLTGITEKEDVYLKHFYDSISIIKAIDLNKINTLCDMGTGAGFPGMVLAIIYPNLKVTLVDSINKRINFLNEVIKELDLKNVETKHDRIEEYSKKNKEKFDVVTARAVAQTNVLLEICSQSIKIGGYFIAMKGNIDSENDYNNALRVLDFNEDKIIKFKLPIENSDRSLLRFKKQKSTNKLFPRKYSEIKKKPL